ncbi:MAG: 30S ribosomal protein S6 [Sedimentisphaerales bacterium]|nr:30S ribosomal protein S6 [Sedimentisphaerales bacterium]
METKRVYEALFLVDSALAASQWDHVMGIIHKILDRAEARVISVRKWDERKLAYEIAGKSRGTYILAYFECGSSKIRPLERDVQLSEEILRVLVVRTDRMTQADMEKPTPAMVVHVDSDAAVQPAAEAVEEAPVQETVE